jgi:hypothetical protein
MYRGIVKMSFILHTGDFIYLEERELRCDTDRVVNARRILNLEQCFVQVFGE